MEHSHWFWTGFEKKWQLARQVGIAKGRQPFGNEKAP